jgi:fumarate reductase subunit D
VNTSNQTTPAGTAEPNQRSGRGSAAQLVGLIGTIVIAVVVGVWAYFFPLGFYEHFPSLLGEWISQDGPYNEHLIRDHGAQYLALGVASAAALIWPSQIGYRLLGIAWTLFGVLHFIYHATHLSHMSATDAIGQLVVLGLAVVLGGLMFIPPRARAAAAAR